MPCVLQCHYSKRICIPLLIAEFCGYSIVSKIWRKILTEELATFIFRHFEYEYGDRHFLCQETSQCTRGESFSYFVTSLLKVVFTQTVTKRLISSQNHPRSLYRSVHLIYKDKTKKTSVIYLLINNILSVVTHTHTHTRTQRFLLTSQHLSSVLNQSKNR